MSQAKRPDISERDIVGFVMDSTRERYERLSWQGGFSDYLARVAEDPYKHTRTAYQLLRDMIAGFGVREFEDNGETVKRWQLFDDPFDDGKNCIFGLDRTIHQLLQYIDAAANEQGKERILLLHGPVGTAKTTMVDLLARGLEAYTATPEGEVYTFAWRFGKDFHSGTAASLGFGAAAGSGDYAGVTNPVAVLPSQLHEHPLLLIPREERRKLLERLVQRRGAEQPVIPHKLLEAELEYNSKQIYNFLIRKYEGNWLKVMDHVLVQRIQFSESAGMGIAKIPPEGNVETASQPVTIDENFRFISNLITSINLIRYHGKYVHGNRGLVHYSDIFKKPAGYLQHLLAAVEEHRMDFGETGCHIDCAIIGTTNIHEYLALRQDPVSKALRSRIRKIDVPYLRNFIEEEKIYIRGLRRFQNQARIAPHTTEMAARWAVMTRLEPTALNASDELDAETKAVLAKLTPGIKTELYAGAHPHELSEKELRRLDRRVRLMLFRELKYEGMAGVPTRVIQDVFADLCEDRRLDCITPFRIFDLLDEVIAQGPEVHDFLARAREEEWFDFGGFITRLRARYDRILRREIQDSVVNVDAAEMEARIRAYLKHVTAYNKKELVANSLTGKDEKPDEARMRAIEDVMGITDQDRDFFRFKILSRASAAASDGKGVNIHDVYKDLFAAVHRNLFAQKRDAVQWNEIERLLERSATKDHFDRASATASPDMYRDAATAIRNLENQHGYAYECARVSILYYIRSLLPGDARVE